ncbi:alpha-2-macroglobulin family protein [Litoribrevibacter albus]|uniref:Alpha-2-macroglobulin n=1 Tax=Litoribrevibacter albus TaxID=1473156 RepID=A0AA37SA81_9GAMM|nr:alpha-2-macroglobulin [Litoribrevibacter albus]GLQ31069.1 alpha-2-macroglobulin [Litoribrevibacter albus]
MFAIASSLMSIIWFVVKLVFSPITWVLNLIFFRFLGISWTVPGWLSGLNETRRTKPKKFWSISLIIFGLLGGTWYHLFVPKPPKVTALLSQPGISQNEETIRPKPLTISFDYQTVDFSNYLSTGLIARPDTRLSVAPIEQVDKEITQGIKLFPNRAGTWRWVGDNRIQFTPDADWPANQEYKVTFAENFFADHIEMADLSYEFTTRDFSASTEDFRLYKDPTKRNAQYLVATVSFSHPVDKETLREHVGFEIIQPQDGGEDLSKTYKPSFEINYGLNDREIYLKSEQISLPVHDQYAYLKVSKELKTVGSDATLSNRINKKVLLPNISDFLKVSNADVRILRNQDNQPEQILSLQFTDGITLDEVQSNLEVYLLPKKDRRWNIDRALSLSKKKMQKLSPEWMENEHASAPYYNLKLDVPEGRAIYVNVKKGMKSSSDYALAKNFHEVIYIDDYPKEASIMGDGSLLSLSGDKTLSLMSRGHTALKVGIHKLQDKQLNHLISQTSGDVQNPYFRNYEFSKDNITVAYEQILKLSKKHPKELNYASVSLASYLKEAGMGVFFVEVSGWDMNRNRQVYGQEDKRLIVVTDLGVIVKKTRDFNRQHVFVQSIATGQAVANASVEVLGKNGVPVFSGTTDPQGQVELHDLSRLYREQQPTVFLVSKGKDRTFLPYDQYTRQINYSRFDVSGETQMGSDQNQLSAYVITDRGIYRPGETVKFANIVKDSDFRSTAGLPLEFTITDARGKKVLSKKLTLNKEGLFDLSFKTKLTSSTGQYQANLYLLTKQGYLDYRLGGVDFTVEEFQPDTMKISSSLIPNLSKGWFNQEQIQAQIELKNLFGTPAQDRKVSATLDLTPSEFYFSQFKGYRFVDPLRDEQAQLRVINERLTDQTTDADGYAKFDLLLNQYAKGTYRLHFEAEGFEAGGGRSVFAQNQALVSPLTQLVGYKADGGLNYLNKEQARSISLIAVNPKLERIALEGLTLQLIRKQPVSTLVMAKDGTYSYQSIIKSKLIKETAFELTTADNTLALDTTDAGDFQLQLLDADQQLLTKIDYQVVAEGNMAGRLEQNAELSLKLNQADYKPGDWIEMNIVAPYAGSGLITIESNKVHAHKWFKTSTNSTLQKIRLPEGIEGNAYVNVAFIRAQDAKEIFMSPLSYAVKPFNIDRSSREVDIQLNTQDIVRPGKPMKIGYTTNKASKIIVFAVDEGILQVAGYQTPAPLDHFLSKRALQVRTYQMLDLILPEYRTLLQHAGIGGGAEAMKLMAANLNPFQRKLDKPAVFWSGVLEADQTERSTEFVVPDTFSGNLRVMAVAVSEQALGATSKDSLVRGPFVLSPNVLTTASPGDEFDVTLGVANLIQDSGDNANITVQVKASNNLEILGDKTRKLTISEGSEDKATFRVKVKEPSKDENQNSGQILGEGNLTFMAHYAGSTIGTDATDVGNEVSAEEAQRSASLSIRPAAPFQTQVSTGYSDGDTELPLTRKLFNAFGEKQVVASASPMAITRGLTTYLSNYVHGCTEQMTSQVFPWINLTAQPEYLDQRPETEEKLATLISTLRSRQHSDGGFSLWSSSAYSATFPTLYASHLLTEAKAAGFKVPDDMFENAISRIRVLASKQTDDLISARHRALAIYLLIRNQSVATSYLIDLHQVLEASALNWQQDITSSYLAASYQLLKKQEEADRLIKLFDPAKEAQGITNYQTADTQFAQYVYLVANHFPAVMETLPAQDTMERLLIPSKEGNLTTINASYTTLALSAYSSRNRAKYGDDKISIEIKPGEYELLTKLSNAGFASRDLALNTQSTRLKAPHPFFYQTVQAGFDRAVSEVKNNQGIEIVKELYDEDGKALTEIHQGQEVTVKLKVRVTGSRRVDSVAVVDLQPGGFEVLRSSVDRRQGYWDSEYIDIREDRLVIYGDFDSGVTELSYKIKATASGDFVVPPVFAEAMYDPKTFGYSAADTLTVKPSKL